VLALPADVSKLADVTRSRRRGVLANSAIWTFWSTTPAVAGPCGATLESVDWEEWTRAIEINLLGSVLLCRAVLPHFKKAKRGKIIQLSGGGATNPLPNLSAYAASKAAVVRFRRNARRRNARGSHRRQCDSPGALNTRMLDEFLAAGPERIGRCVS
jgi:NAD(P)-dependent dehydrogenase (short-subunit alcohol dehydrogenase family)